MYFALNIEPLIVFSTISARKRSFSQNRVSLTFYRGFTVSTQSFKQKLARQLPMVSIYCDLKMDHIQETLSNVDVVI